jgi:acetyltransferase
MHAGAVAAAPRRAPPLSLHGCADRIVLADGRAVVLCPVLPDDAPAEQAFVGALSAASRYRRFHVGLRELTPSLLRHLTQVDQRRHVAIVARSASPDRIVADARYVLDDGGHTAEFAIAVADDWQHAGLGRELLLRLGEHAREHGVSRLHGDVLWDNLPMQRMVSALGGTLTTVSRNAGMLEARFDSAAPQALQMVGPRLMSPARSASAFRARRRGRTARHRPR